MAKIKEYQAIEYAKSDMQIAAHMVAEAREDLEQAKKALDEAIQHHIDAAQALADLLDDGDAG